MEMVKNILKMEITLLENIEMGNLMDLENFIGIMVIAIKENLLMVKGMVMEYGRVRLKKELISIEDNMQMIKNVDKEYLNMLTGLNMKDILQMTKDVDMVKLDGKTRLLTRVIGQMD